jgi:hypothetical protein
VPLEAIMTVTERLLQLLLSPGERLVLGAPGACKTSLRSGWKPGRMILTDQRFIFAAGRWIVSEVPLDGVREVRTERQPLVLARRATVRLTWSVVPAAKAAPLLRKLWLATRDPRAWREAIFQMACLEVSDRAIERVASAVDRDCAALLRYVWQQRHAGTDDLAKLIDAPSHNDVLFRIHRAINPAAAKLLGCSILAFRHRWKASGDSEPIDAHWWIAGRRKSVPTTAAARVSVFAEPDRVDVVADLPGVRASDMVLRLGDNCLVISAASDTQRFHEETSLPAGTRTETMTASMNNGVLLVRFRRLPCRQTA